ncbi:HNH endonuclease [Patescibacteria group bacterium AH-259-L07]|nr:HNH endonuclease [Patescibacteria group bacterium AH-259-L07]
MVETICKKCGNNFKTWVSHLKLGKGKYCSYKCASIGRILSEETKRKIGEKSKGNMYAFKNGRQKAGGYIRLYMPDHPNCNKKNSILEHRYMVECILGRFLEKEEIVHHIDEKKDNNIPENLYLFSSHSEHTKYHHSPFLLMSNLI